MNPVSKTETLEAIERATGLTFVYIPPQIYALGIAKDRARLVLDKRPLSYYIPAIQVQSSGFWIATDLFRLSHWQRLQQSALASALPNDISAQDIDNYKYNWVRDVNWGIDYGFKPFLKDKIEDDPALTLTIEKSAALATSLGLQLPSWSEWEIATRGEKGYLFPWGNRFDLSQVKLSSFSYGYTWEDPESTMGFRETEWISGQYYRIDEWGEYRDMVSPFGLRGLLYWGMEWNLVSKSETPKSLKKYTHILRSLLDLGQNRTTVNLSENEAENNALRSSDHRAFSGIPLAGFASPDYCSKVAAFRFVYIPPSSHSNSATPVTEAPDLPDEMLYALLGDVVAEAKDYLGEPESYNSFDFSTGAFISDSIELLYYSLGLSITAERSYSRISRPTSSKQTAQRLTKITFHSNTKNRLDTRDRFSTYCRSIFEKVKLGMTRDRVMQSSWEAQAEKIGVKAEFEFDREDRLSKVNVTMRDREVSLASLPSVNSNKSLMCLHHLKGHEQRITAVNFLDDNTLLSASQDGTIKRWNITTQQEIQTFGQDRFIFGITALSISQDSQYIVTAGKERETFIPIILVWDNSGETVVRTFSGMQEKVIFAALTSDNQYLISSSTDRRIRIWYLETTRLVQTIKKPDNYRSDVIAISPNNRYVARGSENFKVTVWEIPTGNEILTLDRTVYTADAIAFTPDSQYLIASGTSLHKVNKNLTDKSVTVWEIPTGKLIWQFQEGSANCLAVTPNSRILCSRLQLWDLATGNKLAALPDYYFPASLAITPGGEYLAAGFTDSSIHLYDLTTQQETGILGGHSKLIYAVAISPDSRIVASGSADKTIKLWDIKTGNKLADLRNSQSIKQLSFSRDSRKLLSSNSNEVIEVWDTESYTKIATLVDKLSHENAVILGQNGQAIVTQEDSLYYWNLDRGLEGIRYNYIQLCSHLESLSSYLNQSRGVAIHPQGLWLATPQKDRVSIWNLETGEVVSEFTLNAAIEKLCFSDTEDAIACGLQDGKIVLYDWRSHQPLTTFKRHIGKIRAIAQNPQILVSVGADNDLKVWDKETGKLIATAEAHPKEITSVAMTTDGTTIVTGSCDNSLKVWRF
jgi:WD40 repeat protein